MPDKSWRLRPYLGYDWIAGMASSMYLSEPLSGAEWMSESCHIL